MNDFAMTVRDNFLLSKILSTGQAFHVSRSTFHPSKHLLFTSQTLIPRRRMRPEKLRKTHDARQLTVGISQDQTKQINQKEIKERNKDCTYIPLVVESSSSNTPPSRSSEQIHHRRRDRIARNLSVRGTTASYTCALQTR